MKPKKESDPKFIFVLVCLILLTGGIVGIIVHLGALNKSIVKYGEALYNHKLAIEGILDYIEKAEDIKK